MLLKSVILSLSLIGSTYILAMNGRYDCELLLCATDTPTEVLKTILEMFNKLKRYKPCHVKNSNSPYYCFNPYDDQKQGERDFEGPILAFDNIILGDFDGYVLSDGTVFEFDGREAGRTLPSNFSYSDWQKQRLKKENQENIIKDSIKNMILNTPTKFQPQLFKFFTNAQ